jgi:hypothetical protein
LYKNWPEINVLVNPWYDLFCLIGGRARAHYAIAKAEVVGARTDIFVVHC